MKFARTEVTTPAELAQRYEAAPANESISEALERSLGFAEAMIAAGHEDVLVGGIAPLYASDRVANVQKAVAQARVAIAPSTEGRALIADAERRFGAPLPPTLVALWEVLASPRHRTWLRAFCVHSPVDPLHRDADAREPFTAEHAVWFANAGCDRVSTPEKLARHEPGAFVMLDPALRESLISFARAPSEQWFVATGIASDTYPAPVFSNHDDGEGQSEFHAGDVRAWFSQEISVSIAAVISPA
ncbi:MAG TPA: hypothetical protein VK427_20265 [Kofleriaceae bacterium]|nr:hypothetical protein [Kofleriaceae bacterium]